MAATVTRNPTSDEAVSGTWTGTAGTRYQAVDDYPDAAGADFLTHGTTAGNITFGFTAFAIPSIATSITVLVDYYDRKNAAQADNIGGRLKVGGSYFNAATHGPANGVWTQRTDTWANNPKTVAAWTPDDINGVGVNALQAFGWVSTDASPTIDLSSIRVRVTYTANYVLTAAVGTFTRTGEPAGVRAQRKIAAAKGTFTLTGIAATLRHGYAFVASFGGFTLTRGNATLTAARKLLALPGGFTLTRGNATLTAARKLLALPGGFTLTRGNATLTAARRLLALPGGFTLTRGNATLTAARRLTADVALYAFTGGAADLIYIPGGGSPAPLPATLPFWHWDWRR